MKGDVMDNIRWFRYFEPYCEYSDKIPDSDTTVIVSENYIKKVYYPKWLELMKKRWGDDLDTKYGETALEELCIHDFAVINYAREVGDEYE